MKIAIIGIKGVPGKHGVEVVVDSLLPYLSALGHDVTVYGYDSYTKPFNDYQGARIITVSASDSKNTEMISHMWKAALDVRCKDYDIIHIHNTDPCLLAWLPRAKYGVVATSHGQAYIRKKWGLAARTMSKVAERFFMYLPNVCTSVSKPLAEYYKKQYKKEVLYIPNGIKFREKPDAQIVRKWDLQAGEFFFCSAGRVERTKGLDTLFQAYSQLKTSVPLVIAGGGSGSDVEYLEELKRNKPSGVRFVGFLSGDELFSLYAHAKVFIFPSEYEAMSMALLEGLSFGTPTLYSNIPENRAVAEGLGYSFQVSDAASLAGELTGIIDNYDVACERGQQAWASVRKHHDWAAIAGQYDEVYRGLVK